MAVEEVVGTAGDVLKALGLLGRWIQAIGLVIVFWIIVQIVNLIVNRKKRKALYAIKDDLDRIEKKIDKILGKKK